MKIKFTRDVRFDMVSATGSERLVDFYSGTEVDNVDVDGEWVRWGNGDSAKVPADAFTVVEENFQNFTVRTLTNDEEAV